MREVIKWLLCGIILLIFPVLLWNVWCLDYIDKNGKLLAWICAPLFALVSAGIVVGFDEAKKRLIGTDMGREGKEINPFWGWFGVGLIIEIFIVLASNS